MNRNNREVIFYLVSEIFSLITVVVALNVKFAKK